MGLGVGRSELVADGPPPVRLPNGMVYTGEWKGDKQHGKGSLAYLRLLSIDKDKKDRTTSTGGGTTIGSFAICLRRGCGIRLEVFVAIAL
eukprot:2743844-Amphidinium_carterae.1